MKPDVSTLRLGARQAPSAARLLPQSLAEFADARRKTHEDRLRAEGFSAACADAVGVLEQAAQSMDECRDAWLDSLAQATATLAGEIAQVLLCKELAAGNYDIVAIVRATLASSYSSLGTTTIHVHPDDATALEEVRFRSGTVVQSNPALRRGNVQIETDQGLLVRNLDDCVAAMRESLREALTSC